MVENRKFTGIFFPREIWLAEDLSVQEKFMLAEVDSLSKDGWCWAKNQHFCKLMGIKERRVQDVIKSLKDRGYLRIRYTYKPGTKEIKDRYLQLSAPLSVLFPEPIGAYDENTEPGGFPPEQGPAESCAGVVQNPAPGGAESCAGVVQNPAPGGAKKCAERKALVREPSNSEEQFKKGTAAAEAADPTPDFSQTNFSLEMIARVWEWIKYKKERRFTYKPIGLNALITEIQNNVTKYGEQAVMELINYCMANGYQGIIFDRLNSQSPANRPPQAPQGMPDTFNEFAQRRQRYEGGGNR